MSGIIHKVESEIKQKLHLGHKEEYKKQQHEGDKHKAEEYSGEHKAEHGGHREQVKDLMHKMKKKVAGGHGRTGHRIKWHHDEGEEGEECEEGENEFECEVEEGGGWDLGGFEFNF